MSEDFHIKYNTATRWEGKVHYLMAPPLERIDALMPLLLRLIQSQTDPSGDHVCPICRQMFEVDFYRIPITTDPLYIATYCNTCNIHVSFQSNKIPAWAKAWEEEASVEEFFEKLRKHGDENA